MKPVVGMVVSNKMQKSVVVAVDRLFHHKLYNRYVKRTSKFMAHDEHNECNIGDRVCPFNFLFHNKIISLRFLNLIHSVIKNTCMCEGAYGVDLVCWKWQIDIDSLLGWEGEGLSYDWCSNPAVSFSGADQCVWSGPPLQNHWNLVSWAFEMMVEVLKSVRAQLEFLVCFFHVKC